MLVKYTSPPLALSDPPPLSSLNGGAGAVCLSLLASLFKLILLLSLGVGEEGVGGSTLLCVCLLRPASRRVDERRIAARRGEERRRGERRREGTAGEGVTSPIRPKSSCAHTLSRRVPSASAKCRFHPRSVSASRGGAFGSTGTHRGAELTFPRIAPRSDGIKVGCEQHRDDLLDAAAPLVGVRCPGGRRRC